MENVVEIQALWAEITGFNLEAATRDFDNTNDWRLQTVMKDLRRAQELDPTDSLFLMLLEESLDDHLAQTSVTALQYLSDPAKFDRQLALARRIRELLAGSGMPKVREDLRATVMRALDHYGAGDRADVLELLNKRGSIGYLWRDALEAMDKSLAVHQFLQGDGEEPGYRPLYQSWVLGFWSVNDALRLAANMPSGISLAMIRDREAIHSHFAFVVRNGGNLSIVTDVTDWVHPMQKMMSRRPDRRLEERAGRSRFPYELLNIQYHTDEDGEVVGLFVPRAEGIVPHQARAYKIKRVSEIAADEVAWTAMMFALLTKKFFVDNWKATELSYTAEMVDVPRVLEIAADRAGLPVPVDSYKPLMAAPLHSVELTAERVSVEGNMKTEGTNAWMEARYASQVNDDLLNLTAEPNGATLMLTKSGGTTELTAQQADSYKRGFRMGLPEDLHSEISQFDASLFGSAERLAADRLFIARFNQAREIGRLADAEFDRRKSEITAWWQDVIKRRTEFLFERILANSLAVKTDLSEAAYYNPRNFTHLKDGEREILHRLPLKETLDDHFRRSIGVTVLGGRDYRVASSKYRCAKSGRPATDGVRFRVTTADDVAAVAGLQRSELPDVLQHYSATSRHAGNHLLNRIDPMDWSVRNPWSSLNFEILVFVSRFVFPTPPERERRPDPFRAPNAGNAAAES